MERDISFPYEGKDPYVFVSYSHRDMDRVMPILQRLNAEGFRIWYDEGIDPGTEWPESIARHLNGSRVVLAFISQNAISSHNCRREINYALSKNLGFLWVMLEPCEMSPGLEMQLSSYQALMSYTYSSAERFYDRLLSLDILQSCKEISRSEEKNCHEIPRKPEKAAPEQKAPENQKPDGAKKNRWLIFGLAGAAALLLLVFLIPKLFSGGSDFREETGENLPQEDVLPAAAVPEISLSGDIEDLSWKLEDGVLTVRGKGGLGEDYQKWESAPWSEQRESITEIIIEEGITRIGYGVFSEYSNVTSVSLSEGLLQIEYDAFAGCEKLENVALPDSLEYIGAFAFNATALKAVTIPPNVYQIDAGAFGFIGSLDTIDVHPDSPWFCSVDGILFNKDMTEILCYPCGRKDVEYRVPEGVIRIGGECFGGCGLKEVVMPDSLLEIGEGAFELCGLEKLCLPSGLKTIEDHVFYANGFNSVTIPASVESIGRSVFVMCQQLGEINVEKGNRSYSSENGVLFNADKTELICYPCGKKGEAYAIPAGVTTITSGAFADNDMLKKVAIPSSVHYIEDSAFAYCKILSEITIPEKVERIDEDAFIGCTALKTVTLPAGLKVIGLGAFAECYQLTVVNFMGNESQWNDVEVREYNELLNEAEIRFNA